MREITVVVDNPSTKAARRLIGELDAYLENLYPPESNYLLSVEALKQPNVTFITARLNGEVIGCGAFVNHDGEYAEVKRMFVLPGFRGMKIGRRLLEELESRASLCGIKMIRLETGVYQTEALRLYTKAGYTSCGPFGDYRPDDPLCVFMEKNLT